MRIPHLYICSLSLLAALAHATPKPSAGSDFPLPNVSNSTPTISKTRVGGFDTIESVVGIDLSQYKDFLIVAPVIEFDKHWRRDIRFDMSKGDETRILTTYSEVFNNALRKALETETTLTPVTSVSANTLVIEPKLERFRITAPDLSFAAHTENYVDYVGSAQVRLILKSGANNAVLATLSDHDQTQSFNGPFELKKTNRAENVHDFKRLFKRWSNKLAKYIVVNSAGG